MPLFLIEGEDKEKERVSKGALDLNELVMKHPPATYFVKMGDDSAASVGIFAGDILVVDRAIEPHSGHVVLVVEDEEFRLKKCKQTEKGLEFLRVGISHQNKTQKTAKESSEFKFWGVVTYTIHQVFA
jgi:DNA polymerase V